MKRILAIGIILLFIGLSISSSTGFNVEKQSTTPLNGKTLYVGGSGPGNYSKVQDAINDSEDGDTVFVYDGRYYENIIINKTIDLIGENWNTPIIDGNYSGDVVFITAHFVKVSGFIIIRSGEDNKDCGIENRGKNTIITRNIFSQNFNGVKLGELGDKAYHNLVKDNIFINNTLRGIWLTSNNTLIEDNYINGTRYGISGYFGDYFNNTIVNNTILSCKSVGIKLCNNFRLKIVGNIIKSNKIGIELLLCNSYYVIDVLYLII